MPIAETNRNKTKQTNKAMLDAHRPNTTGCLFRTIRLGVLHEMCSSNGNQTKYEEFRWHECRNVQMGCCWFVDVIFNVYRKKRKIKIKINRIKLERKWSRLHRTTKKKIKLISNLLLLMLTKLDFKRIAPLKIFWIRFIRRLSIWLHSYIGISNFSQRYRVAFSCLIQPKEFPVNCIFVFKFQIHRHRWIIKWDPFESVSNVSSKRIIHSVK